MAVSTIDGVVEAADERRRKGKYVLFNRVLIRDAAGAEHELKTVAAADPVAAALKPGARGRFYVTKALDQTGIHGVKLEDGAASYPHYNNMELMTLIWIGAALLLAVLSLTREGGATLLAVIMLPLSILSYVLFRNARTQGGAQFRADNA
ncbi:MAG TPA: hypothetical protein VIO94_02330 [Phenylobacterium sp.]